jgi:hypothetical protein
MKPISLAISLIFVLCIAPAAVEASGCDFDVWTQYRGTELSSHPTVSAYYFATEHMAVDADGAPNAYHPEDMGLDFLANAGYPTEPWWIDVLVPDPENADQAFLQPDGEYRGYFVSKTALQDTSKSVTDTARYVDARHIPYLVFPGSFYRMSGTGLLGDLGVALNLSNGKKTPFIVADIGPSSARLGEVSINFAERLGGEQVSPRDGSGMPGGEVLYIVFPYSAKQRVPRWPLSLSDLEHRTDVLLEQLGGIESVLVCHQPQ